MTFEHWAQTLLFGNSLEEKLLPPPQITLQELEAQRSLVQTDFRVPLFPGRPSHLSKFGKSTFPAIHQLHLAEERGRVLHFFANHELLALELMALVLLRFPEAPANFRMGVAKVIAEEQGHLQLYINRMKELGVELGDIPVNDYFWKCMKDLSSPLDFTVQMSLTFEQANLDFSYFYMNEVKKVGDDLTAALLERVFREEMGHVKHGLVWFNRWRDQRGNETEWEAYRQLLPYPLNPQRAKGPIFCGDSRKQIGFSENYIRELRAFAGSKGRPPVVWFYNPQCDQEVLRGKPGFSPSAPGKKMQEDLQSALAFVSQKTDLILVNQKPSLEWIESLHSAGIETPEFSDSIDAPKLAGIEPWGWSPDAVARFQPLCEKLIAVDGGNSEFAKKALRELNFAPKDLGQLYSKAWSVQFLQTWLEQHPDLTPIFGNPSDAGQVHTHWDSVMQAVESVLLTHPAVMIKAPFGTSGMQVKRITQLSELEGPTGGWVRRILKTQGKIIIEPYLNRIADLSIQLKIQENDTILLEVRQFMTGIHHEYRGTRLGAKGFQLSPLALRFLHDAIQAWKPFLRDLGQAIRELGYRGPAGVDAFLWRTPQGEFRLKPLVELNPRWTMGRIALEIEKHLAPGVRGAWAFLPIRELPQLGYSSVQCFVEAMQNQYPVVTESLGERIRIRSGVLFTNDPNQAQTVLTALVTFPNPELLLEWQKPVTD